MTQTTVPPPMRMATRDDECSGRYPGQSEAVRGSVVDAHFSGRIPPIFNVLRAGDDGHVLVEVISHLETHTVRGIALTPTRGLSRGSAIIDTGQPLRVPVGDVVLGRMFNVFGETIDGKEPIEGAEWRSIHAPQVDLMRRSTASEVFITGIKAIDVLAPIQRGGKPACLAGPEFGQNGSDHGTDS